MGTLKVHLFRSVLFILGIFCVLAFVSPSDLQAMDQHAWSDQEKTILRSLWIGSLPPLPVDPSNRYSDNPKVAAFGKKLFFEDNFSGNMKVSCATCHRQDYSFTDNLPQSHGMATTPRRSVGSSGTAALTVSGPRPLVP